MDAAPPPPERTPRAPSDRRQRIARWALVGFGILLIFAAGAATSLVVTQSVVRPHQVSAVESNDVPSALKEAWALVHDRYVDQKAIDDEKMSGGAISGMLQTLGDDGHTRYLAPDQVAPHEQSLSGTYVGVGIQVEDRDGHVVVVTPIDNSPALRAGIKSGDVLTQVNGQSIEGLELSKVVEQVRGPEGSTVTLTFQRPGQTDPFTVTLQRAKLETTSVTWAMLPGQIAVIRLSDFSHGASDQLGRAITAAEAAHAQGIVFDLRNNPGGLVDEAIGVASHFLPEGTPVFVSEVGDGTRTIHRTQATNVRTTLPMVVLVNKGTASASEIVTGALKDNGRAKTVGETTFGTGTVLNQFGLSDGSAILLGTELWRTPNGNLIRGQGILPDVTITLSSDQSAFVPSVADPTPAQIPADAQLQRAMRVLTGTPEPASFSAGCSRCF